MSAHNEAKEEEGDAKKKKRVKKKFKKMILNARKSLCWGSRDSFHAERLDREPLLKGARHSSKSRDSPRHFYSDKLHHKDKWRRRNYCSRAARIAAAGKCSSPGQPLYQHRARVLLIRDWEEGKGRKKKKEEAYHHQEFITQINKDIWTYRRQFKVYWRA